MEKTECVLVEMIAQGLSRRFGQASTTASSGGLSFEIRPEFGGGQCELEGQLSCTLGGSSPVRTKIDILLRSLAGRTVAIECKFLSSVSDQFKCRAHDMMHLKEKYGQGLSGVMPYVHALGCGGIGLKRAEAYCCPYDRFLGYEIRTPQEVHQLEWGKLHLILEEQLRTSQLN